MDVCKGKGALVVDRELNCSLYPYSSTTDTTVKSGLIEFAIAAHLSFQTSKAGGFATPGFIRRDKTYVETDE